MKTQVQAPEMERWQDVLWNCPRWAAWGLFVLFFLGLALVPARPRLVVLFICAVGAILPFLLGREYLLVVLMAFIPLPFAFSIPEIMGYESMTPVDLVLILAAVVWLAEALVRRRRFILPIWTPLNAPILALLVVAGASLLWFPRYEAGLESYIRLIEGTVVFFLVLHIQPDRKHLRIMVWALGLSTVVMGLCGFYVRFVGSEAFLLNAMPGYTEEMTFFSVVGIASDVGHFVAFMICLWAGLFLATTRRFTKMLIAMVLGFYLVVLVYSMSRGSWLGLMASALLVTVLHRPMRRWLAWALVLGAAVSLFYGRAVVQRINAIAEATYNLKTITDSNSAMQRFVLWRGAVKMIRERPLRGHGFGAFQVAYEKLIPKGKRSSAPSAHNIFLDYWVGMGLPGLVVLMWLLKRLWCENRFIWRRSRDPLFKGLSLALSAVFISFLVTHLLNDFLFSSHNFEVGALIWMIFGMVALIGSQLRTEGMVEGSGQERDSGVSPARG